jgi:glycosyltransferase involved in cell wall biosynthesis
MNNGFLYLVRTVCYTYNHENYILDALKSFAMQQTSFPVVYTIVDDASTDNTPVVLRQFVEENFDLGDALIGYEKDTDYGHVTFARHKTNENCYFAVVYLKENHYSQKRSKAPYLTEWDDTKYIAICEGDDYWTDPLKLQKQVDFLEAHEEYSMCFHGAKVLNECGAKVTSSYQKIKEGDYGPNDIFPMWVVPTASVVYRRELIDGYHIKHGDWLVYGDIVLFEKCAHVGKIYGFEKTMSVYRMNEGSMLQNPKYMKDRLLRMPNHFRALKMNFPLIDRTVLRQLIADTYYARMRNESNALMKVWDFFRFVFFCPRYSFRKLCCKLKKRKTGHGSEK